MAALRIRTWQFDVPAARPPVFRPFAMVQKGLL